MESRLVWWWLDQITSELQSAGWDSVRLAFDPTSDTAEGALL
jgi:hypothetical protein